MGGCHGRREGITAATPVGGEAKYVSLLLNKHQKTRKFNWTKLRI